MKQIVANIFIVNEDFVRKKSALQNSAETPAKHCCTWIKFPKCLSYLAKNSNTFKLRCLATDISGTVQPVLRNTDAV